MVRELLKAIGGGPKTSRALTRDEARTAMGLIADGQCAPEQVGAFLMALRYKGETADELAGFVEALEARMPRAQAPPGTLDVDAHGDGHEGRATVLPEAARAAAALGVPVLLRVDVRSPYAKHGLADSLPCPPASLDEAVRSLAERKLAVLDLPSYSPVLARLVGLRALFGRRTVAQTLCKLVDPLRCERHLVGVFHAPYLPSTWEALQALGRSGLCVQALGVLPEASPGKILRAAPANLDFRAVSAPDAAAATCALMLHAALGEPIAEAFSRAREVLLSRADL